MDKFAIGIDIGGTRTKAGLVNLTAGTVIATQVFATEKDSASAFEQGLGQAIVALQAQQPGLLAGIGIGVSGFVFANGTVDSTYGFMPFMEQYPLTEIISKAHQLPCQADNDARLVALGEARYGTGQAHNRVLALTLGTGLGVGFVAGKQLGEPLPYAHMAGHLCMDVNGPACYCGKRGCLENRVSASAIVRAMQETNWVSENPAMAPIPENLFKAARVGQPLSAEIVNHFLAYLKAGIFNYINIYAPDCIILGGGVAKSLGPYLDDLLENLPLGPYTAYRPTLALSALNENAGILGSAALFAK